jgi:hypothetical protein
MISKDCKEKLSLAKIISNKSGIQQAQQQGIALSFVGLPCSLSWYSQINLFKLPPFNWP